MDLYGLKRRNLVKYQDLNLVSGKGQKECHDMKQPPNIPISLDTCCVLNTLQYDQLDYKDLLKMYALTKFRFLLLKVH